MSEWEEIGHEQDKRLKSISFSQNASAQQLIETLRSRLDIREGYQGLEIASTSFVGRVDIGSVRISIVPKLPAMPLSVLLRYAYGIRDISVVHRTEAPTARHGLHDLLIEMLASEVEELIHKGLVRHYVRSIELLQSPRGSLFVTELARRGGITEASLPCRTFRRLSDWPLNRLLRAGLEAAADMTDDRDLRRYVSRIANAFEEVGRINVTNENIINVQRSLTRMTESYASVLEIIHLLHGMLGAAFEAQENQSRMPGFLFDMNKFFQRLISRLLRDSLEETVVDEWAIQNVFAFAPDANPKQRKVPSPRPDFALFRGKTLLGFLDAKYRDIWNRGLPADWLYQLSIYALASPTRSSLMLYATTNREACDECIEVRQPVEGSKMKPASVIVRPVNLQTLARYVNPDLSLQLSEERRQWARQLVS